MIRNYPPTLVHFYMEHTDGTNTLVATKTCKCPERTKEAKDLNRARLADDTVKCWG